LPQKIIHTKYQKTSGNTLFQTFRDKGLYGEYKTFQTLNKLDCPKHILTNLYIPRADGTTTEIDLVLLTEKGIFVVESKNFSGWIYGHEQHKHWTQTFPNRKKFSFFNPVWQNKAHINALQAILKLPHSASYQSFIIFSERCVLKKIHSDSPYVTVLKRNKLLLKLRETLLASEKIFTLDELDRIYRFLDHFTQKDQTVKAAHIKKVQSKHRKPNQNVIYLPLKQQKPKKTLQ